MKVIGITGGIGSGKSALLNTIKENYNCIVLFADDIANYLKLPGEACYLPIVKLLGTDILDANGFIDNKKMAQVIFKDSTLLEAVNKIVHPAVYDYILQAIADAKDKGNVDFCFVEAALFIEAGYQAFSDSVWYIKVPKEIRESRLVESRGYSLEIIASIMQKQLQEEAFLSVCDVVIDNSGSLAQTMEQVDKALYEYEIM